MGSTPIRKDDADSSAGCSKGPGGRLLGGFSQCLGGCASDDAGTAGGLGLAAHVLGTSTAQPRLRRPAGAPSQTENTQCVREAGIEWVLAAISRAALISPPLPPFPGDGRGSGRGRNGGAFAPRPDGSSSGAAWTTTKAAGKRTKGERCAKDFCNSHGGVKRETMTRPRHAPRGRSSPSGPRSRRARAARCSAGPCRRAASAS